MGICHQSFNRLDHMWVTAVNTFSQFCLWLFPLFFSYLQLCWPSQCRSSRCSSHWSVLCVCRCWASLSRLLWRFACFGPINWADWTLSSGAISYSWSLVSSDYFSEPERGMCFIDLKACLAYQRQALIELFVFSFSLADIITEFQKDGKLSVIVNATETALIH